jgi:formylglycine-generating enzyme required for sulfatase activity
MKEELGVPLGYEFTLPREAEWEHACRAGTATPFHVGLALDNRQANIGNSFIGTSTVGMYSANPWGLHDMHGNVREWCQDALGYGPLSVQGRASVVDGFYRSLRGGSWSLGAEFSRSAYRASGNPFRKHDDVGLRLGLAAVQ